MKYTIIVFYYNRPVSLLLYHREPGAVQVRVQQWGQSGRRAILARLPRGLPGQAVLHLRPAGEAWGEATAEVQRPADRGRTAREQQTVVGGWPDNFWQHYWDEAISIIQMKLVENIRKILYIQGDVYEIYLRGNENFLVLISQR